MVIQSQKPGTGSGKTLRGPVLAAGWLAGLLLWQPALAEVARTPAGSRDTAADAASAAAALTLGIGDAVSVQVYGKPELTTATYVAEDGAIQLPLIGSIAVAELSPARAAERIASAFRDGKYLVDPQVTVTLTQFRGQQVSVLGAVRTPGRYVVESKSTVLDVLAQAGGTSENGANVIVLLRPDKSGKVVRQPIDLKGLGQDGVPVPTLTVRGGDSIFVPEAAQFYIHGEVRAPNMYRLEPGMTVVQAISRGGGITPRGSNSRIEIRRQRADGSYATRPVELNETVRANDVIRVKESIF